jgi:predicted TPR repeat methyltransferase
LTTADDAILFDPAGEVARLIGDGRARDAADACARIIQAGRGGALVRAAHGRALTAAGRHDEAIAALREASQLSPNTAELLLAFGEALAAAGSLPAAIGEMQRAARLAPDDARPHVEIARLWLDAGEADKALESLEAAQHRGLDNDVMADEMRRRADAMRHLQRADAGYVRHLFDQFSADYDERMQGRLGYAAPQILRQLAMMLIVPMTGLRILDLGCGTGLSGAVFRDAKARCDGLDLSPRMLEKARLTGAYDLLLAGDVEAPPAALAGPYDLVVAADVLVYLGDLSAVFARVRERLVPEGLWLFTTEQGDALPFELGPKRRYRHGADYLRQLAETHGFDVCSLVACECRHEAGQGVASWAAAFRAV